MPKLRGGGQVPVLFTAFAFNEETGAAEGYVEFHDQIWSNNLIDRFEELGATSVDVMTFQHNDGNHSAASAYNRVRKVAGNPGFTLITTGNANAKLLTKANDLLENEKPTKSTSQEFDEKAHAAIKKSLSDIADSMVTKDDYQSLGESSQKNFEEIKERMAKEHAAVVGTLSKTIRDQQQIIENMENKISRQSYVLARLNQERDETAKELKAKDQRILKLQEENHALKFGDSTQDEMKTMVTELLEESRKNKRQRTQEA